MTDMTASPTPAVASRLTTAGHTTTGGWTETRTASRSADLATPAAAFPNPPPVHTVEFCLSADNGANGFYANHQPGQAANWYNNTAYNNHGNFNMLEAIDTNAGRTAA